MLYPEFIFRVIQHTAFFFRLTCFYFADHFITSLYTFPAAFCAFLAMFHIVGFTLLSTPAANLRTNVTVLFYIWAVALHGCYAETADFDTLPAAVRTIIFARFIHHIAQALLAISNAFKAGVDAVLVIHGYGF